MSKGSLKKYAILGCLPILFAAWPAIGSAQVPVDESGNPITVSEATGEEIPLLTAAELADLVGPIALYPDDLLAIVLPASTYPLQLVQADRFLEDLEGDPSLQPDESWDDSIVALVNYPEVVELLTDDLDKTWRLGEAVVAQQADVVAAVEAFRDRAYATGNLQSDTHQTVSQNEGVIEITPVEEDVIYVPYYEPERVVVYQSRPAYNYYPTAYPVYYYPYAAGYSFNHGFFWGVTTAFTIGWYTDSLHVYHHSYHGHPYYGHSYGNHYWYRQPDIYSHNNYYYNSHSYNGHSYNGHSYDRYRHGDHWRPQSRSTISPHDQRVTRSRHYPGTGSNNGQTHTTRRTVTNSPDVKFRNRSSTTRKQTRQIETYRSRTEQSDFTRSGSKQSDARRSVSKQERPEIRFRERSSKSTPQLLASNRPSQSRSTQSNLSEPSRTNQRTHSSQPSRANRTMPTESHSDRSRNKQSHASQPPRSSQPSHSSQPSRSSQSSHSSKPSRSGQSSHSSKPQKSHSGSSGSNKSANSSRGNSGRHSGDRR